MQKHPYIEKYIAQRMKELGHEHYHYETIRPYEPTSQLIIDASNEFYYLVDDNIDPTLQILSDNEPLLASESAIFGSFTFHGFREFTGQIIISQLPPGFAYEFIRATPYDPIIN